MITNKLDQPRVLDENLKLFHRSKSMPPSTILIKKNKDSTNNNSTNNYNSSFKMNKNNDVNTDRLKMAKEEAEKAIKVYILNFIIIFYKLCIILSYLIDYDFLILTFINYSQIRILFRIELL